MQELVERIQKDHGLSTEQSHGILNTIKEFIKEKFPMMGGAVDNLFPADAVSGATPAGDTGTNAGPTQKGGSFLDKISDYLPREMGEKAEQFAKNKMGSFMDRDK